MIIPRDTRKILWKTDANGSWSTAGNWVAYDGTVTWDPVVYVPNAAHKRVWFGQAPGAASLTGRTITLDQNATLGELVINAATVSLTLSPSTTEKLVFQTCDGTNAKLTKNPNISPTISCPIELLQDLDVTLVFAATGIVQSGVISGSKGINIISSSSGTSFLRMHGVNTYSGDTNLQVASALQIYNPGSAVNTLVNLAVSGTEFNINATTVGTTIGAISGVAGSTITAQGKTLTVGDTRSTTFSGTWVVNGSTILVKQGSGTWTLASAMGSATLAININAGRILYGIANALSTAANVTLANVANCLLDLDGFSGSFTYLQGGGASGGWVNVGSGSTLSIAPAVPTTYSGIIYGLGSLSKGGVSTQTFNRACLFMGNVTHTASEIIYGVDFALPARRTHTLSNNAGLLLNLGVYDDIVMAYTGSGDAASRGVTANGGDIQLGGPSITITNIYNSGGLIRITCDTKWFLTGDVVQICNVTGTGNVATLPDSTWTVTVIDSTTLELQGSAWSGSYTSGGIVYFGATTTSALFSGRLEGTIGAITKVGNSTWLSGNANGTATISSIKVACGFLSFSAANSRLGASSLATITIGDAAVNAPLAGLTLANGSIAHPIVVAACGGIARLQTITSSGSPNFGGSIALNKDLYFYNSGTLSTTITGPITGNFTLHLDNAASGGYTLSSGSIPIDGTGPTSVQYDGTSSGSGSFTINTDLGPFLSSLIVNTNATGALILGTAQTFTCNPLVKKGILRLGNSSQAMGGAGVIVQLGDAATGANVALEGNNSQTYARGINIVSGAGARRLSASSSPSPIFSGAITLNNNLEISTLNTASITCSGAISGTGNITVKSNVSGNITLSSASVNFVGSITNNGAGTGACILSGTFGSSITSIVQNSATSEMRITGTTNLATPVTVTLGHLEGTGTIGDSLTVQNNVGADVGGGVNGGSGTLTVSGNLTFAGANSAYVVRAGAGVAAKTAVTGTTALGGCTINIIEALNVGTHVIIQGTGTMSGTLPVLGTNLSGRSIVIQQTGNNLELVAT